MCILCFYVFIVADFDNDNKIYLSNKPASWTSSVASAAVGTEPRLGKLGYELAIIVLGHNVKAAM